MNFQTLAVIEPSLVISVVTVVLSIATVVIAVTAALIAGNANNIAKTQAETARRNLAFGLYERRLNIFKATRRLIDAVSVDYKIEPKELNEFIENTEEIAFILPADIVSYVNSVRKIAIDLRHSVNAIIRLQKLQQTPPESLLRNDSELTHRLVEIMEKVKEPFIPYLDFSDIKAR